VLPQQDSQALRASEKRITPTFNNPRRNSNSMPPNRKTNVTLEDIPTFDVLQLKLAAVAGDQATSKTTTKQTEPDVSYWEWPTHEDPLVERILQDETIRANLSVSHIEENLVKEARRLAAEAKEESNVENDEFWNMTLSSTEEKPLEAEKSEETVPASCIQWPSVVVESKEQMIQLILEEERARNLTSVGFYEQGLAGHSCGLANATLNADNDLYWGC
jgi:hypothetical protein